MQYEVIEKSTGAKMSHTKTGELMGSTLFDSVADAEKWMKYHGLTATHSVKPV